MNRLSFALEEAGEEISGTVHLSMTSHVMCPLLEDLHGLQCISFHTDQLNDVLQPITLLRAYGNDNAFDETKTH